jgi:hypothetical protein
MSFLDYIFPSKKKDDKAEKSYYLFTNEGQVKYALFQIDGLRDDEKRREKVKDIIMRHLLLGNGHGLTRQNYKDNVLPELYKLVEKNEITQTTYERLKRLA